MGRGQPLAHLLRVVERGSHGERSALEPRRERFPLQQLEDDIGLAALDSDVEDREDVRVVERARGPGLVFEAAPPVGVRLRVGPDDLDRDVAPEPRVTRAVDLAHASRAEGSDDPVRTERRIGGEHGARSRYAG
jgi:hypothetical protein